VIVDALRQNNVLPIFAAGNEGVNTSRYPGNYDNVLSIGAFDSGGAVADFSSSQTFARPLHPSVPLLLGPGVGIISSVPGGTYEQMDGTSMATPHIAGLAALLLQANPGATMAQLEAAIAGSCTRLSGMTADRAGAGVPDAVRALTAIMGGAALPALAAPAAAPRPRKTAGRAAAAKPRKAAPRKAKKAPKKAKR
jgi:subtilisin